MNGRNITGADAVFVLFVVTEAQFSVYTMRRCTDAILKVLRVVLSTLPRCTAHVCEAAHNPPSYAVLFYLPFGHGRW